MSRTAFVGLVVVVMVIGAGIGAWLGRPQPLPAMLHAHLMPAGPDAPPDSSLQPTGADQAPGADKREVLRASLAAALDGIEASPCDATARKAFFDAWTERAMKVGDDDRASGQGEAPAFWRTDEDHALDQRVGKLTADGYINTDELERPIAERAFGPAAGASMPMQADKCGLTAASQS